MDINDVEGIKDVVFLVGSFILISFPAALIYWTFLPEEKGRVFKAWGILVLGVTFSVSAYVFLFVGFYKAVYGFQDVAATICDPVVGI